MMKLPHIFRNLPVLFIGLILLAALIVPVAALKNPAVVYCQALGYGYSVETNARGDQAPMCTLPDGTTVNAWQFLLGNTSSRYGYCAKQGFVQKTVASRSTCIVFNQESCVVCVNKDGTETEVTKLMNLSFDETTCGDGSCGFPETSFSCPADCKTGGRDNYCDVVIDGRCDPDCIHGGDTDCALGGNAFLYAGLILIVILVAGVFVIKKRSGERK